STDRRKAVSVPPARKIATQARSASDGTLFASEPRIGSQHPYQAESGHPDLRKILNSSRFSAPDPLLSENPQHFSPLILTARIVQPGEQQLLQSFPRASPELPQCAPCNAGWVALRFPNTTSS